ncbi:MAG: TonB-dependent receptor plug domain-containing protein [Bacteroidota bacterium]|nr:TonB-dependent receptor plug domain-containing protein [Bacteroidota bacterium]MDP4255914.1 TonB-dependent receptor plug domain-containing protein [Bacteroidota bacterium]
MQKINLLLLFLLTSSTIGAQSTVPEQENKKPVLQESYFADSSDTRPLREVIVKAYEQNRKLSEVGAPVSFVGKAALNRYSNTSVLPALNTVPGVRMEERSPGSYRLNIRGSSLRSPFGVRDIKIYWNEIPLTDPGGNTYLNQLGYYNFQSIEVIKGTAGSLYGAGIGGAVLINSMPAVWQKGVNLDYLNGSFASNSMNLNVRLGDEDHRTSVAYSHQTSDGYRVQTNMRRDIASWETLIKAGARQTIHAFILYGDLYYQTPGALNIAEFSKNPRQARPPAGTQPGAVQAQAAIYQKNFTAGFSQEFHLSAHWQNTTAVYGAYTDFSNPGIRVYEIRQEPHFGGRSVFQYKTRIGADAGGAGGGSELQVNGGVEAQKGWFETRDYPNKGGTPDTLQTDDHTNNWQTILFAQADLKMPGGWIFTAGASLNKSAYRITRLSVAPPAPHTVAFENKVAPRISVLKKIGPELSVYGSASRGFSTPTVSEVEKSNGIIGPALQPEDGVDYELGARGSLFRGRLFFDVNAFFFQIRNAIVQRIDSSGIMYSVNAGGTNQHGIESTLSYQIADNAQRAFSNVRVWLSHTWHDFHYRSFIQDTSSYSGHRLPSVPPQTLVAGADLVTRSGLYLNITFTYADRIALNDANSAYAGSYNLLGYRLGYRAIWSRRYRVDVFGGEDNALSTNYSLGNDINAAAGRYYNAAPRANYFIGLSLAWIAR